MKQSQRKRLIVARVRDQIGKPVWMPVGYYKNRPSVAAKLIGVEVGTLESFRFIVAKAKS